MGFMRALRRALRSKGQAHERLREPAPMMAPGLQTPMILPPTAPRPDLSSLEDALAAEPKRERTGHGLEH